MGRKEKDFIRVFARFKLLYLLQHQDPFTFIYKYCRKAKKTTCSIYSAHKQRIRFFYITPSDLSTRIGKRLSFFQQVCSASLISEYQRLMSNIKQIVMVSKTCTQKCAILNLLPYFNLKAVNLLHNNFNCLSIEQI